MDSLFTPAPRDRPGDIVLYLVSLRIVYFSSKCSLNFSLHKSFTDLSEKYDKIKTVRLLKLCFAPKLAFFLPHVLKRPYLKISTFYNEDVSKWPLNTLHLLLNNWFSSVVLCWMVTNNIFQSANDKIRNFILGWVLSFNVVINFWTRSTRSSFQ